MRGVICYADGSPCPTLVLPAQLLPEDEDSLSKHLLRIRAELPLPEGDRILKYALISPETSASGGDGLSYRFVQQLPGHSTPFEFRGSCGHSITAAVVGGARLGYLPMLAAGQRTEVRTLNNGDHVTCTVERADDRTAAFTVDFRRRRPLRLRELLLFGEPTIDIDHSGGRTRLSGVSLGNPYVFVDSADVGCPGPAELFAAHSELFAVLSSIREAAQQRLGWRPGAFPKIAALARTPEGIAARAISVPSWHPSLALTGLACLAAAVALPGTVPEQLATTDGGPLTVTTPSGMGTVAATIEKRAENQLDRITVFDKKVEFIGEVLLGEAASQAGRRQSAMMATGGTL